MFETGLAHDGETVHAVFDKIRNVIEVRLELVLGVIPGYPFRVPLLDLAFIQAQNQTVHFLANVNRAVRIAYQGQVGVSIFHHIHGLKQNMGVLARYGGNFKPNHFGNPRRPETGGINHDLTGDVALVRVHHPFSRGGLIDADHPGMGIDLGTMLSGTDAHGHGNTVGVHIPVIRPVESSLEIIRYQQGVQFTHLFRRHPTDIQPQAAIHAVNIPQLLHAAVIISSPDGTGGVPAHGLAGFLFQGLVQFDALHVDLGAVVITMEKRAVARSHPCGTRSQFVFFNQNHILPAIFCQMVSYTDTNGATSNYNDSSLCFHDDSFHHYAD